MFPIIGISGSRDGAQGQLFVRENYVQAVMRAGGLPVLLPRTKERSEADALLGRLDGLLLAGGVDVEPARYGETTLPVCGEIDPERDAFEMLAIDLALTRGLPVFGICRGIQALAVALGGALYQDVAAQLGIDAGRHSQQPPYDCPAHAVRFEPNGLFERVTCARTAQVNSMHHQAVKDPGPYLIVEGRSEDGIIEAVRMAGRDDVFAVQYHPEYLQSDVSQAKLFAYFVGCAGEYAAARR